jgi:hypothetical protein
MNRILIMAALVALTACTKTPSQVRITQDEPEPKKAQDRIVATSKSEPVFYNGKTYKVDMGPLSAGTYAIAISGMSAKQGKDAEGLTSSAFHHFTCKDSQNTNFLTKPAYDGVQWNSTAKCS